MRSGVLRWLRRHVDLCRQASALCRPAVPHDRRHHAPTGNA
ncbi:putative leader peptide [uncultured Thermomonospora sp.]